MKNFIDFHCHILPALDDGALDLRASLKMAQALKTFGFCELHCTPHLIVGNFENPPVRVREATVSLQKTLLDEGIELRLTPGTEHYLNDELMERLDGALCVGASGYLLVEAPFRCLPEQVYPLTTRLLARNLTPLIAHPERCSAFAPYGAVGKVRGTLARMLGFDEEPGKDSLFGELYRSGCRFQGNLGSFAGVYGEEVKLRALGFLKRGGYSCLGSDAHQGEHLGYMLQLGYQAVVDAVGEEKAVALLRGTLM